MELKNYEGLYTLDYRTVNGSPVVFLFIRNKDGTKTIERINNFIPYCYVRDDMISKIPTNISTSFKKGFVDIYGKNVTKCFVNNPYDIYNIRMPFKTAEGNYDGIYEADCLYSLRYAIDNIGEVIPTKYKILTFDIETASEQGFARKENPIEKIISISAHDNYSDKIISWCWREDLEVKQEGDINYFNNEVAMLNSFLDYFNKMNADIVSGWNCAAFDMGYLYARLKYLGISPLKLSSVDVNEFDKYESNLTVVERQHGELEVLGLVIFDALRAYRQLHFGQLVSFSLNNIAIIELGEEKYPIINIDDAWKNDIETLIKYNRKDVELTIGIINKCKLIGVFDHIKRFAGTRNINDCFYMSRIHDTRILRKYHNKLAFPTKPEFREKRESDKLQGAYVFSKPGLYDNVVTLDYIGLYPNIMKTFNLSVEQIDMENGILVNKETGLKISFDKQGIVPSIVDDLLRLKQELKEQMREGGSQDLRDKLFAIKVVINCFSSDTSIITKYGIKNIKDIKIGDEVFSFNPKTASCEYKRVVSTMKQKHRGDMIKIKNQNIDLLVTPNHRFLTRYKKETFKWMTADEVYRTKRKVELPFIRKVKEELEYKERKKKGYDFFPFYKYVRKFNPYIIVYNRDKRFKRLCKKFGIKIRKTSGGNVKTLFKGGAIYKCRLNDVTDKQIEQLLNNQYPWFKKNVNCYLQFDITHSKIPLRFKRIEFAKFLAWYITEGSLCVLKNPSNGISYCSDIMQKKYIKEIKNLLKKLDITHSTFVNKSNGVTCFRISNVLLYKYLYEMCGKGAHNKKIPEFIFNMSCKHKEEFLDTLCRGDGYWRDERRHYVTVSYQLADDFITLNAHLGYHTNMCKSYDNTSYQQSGDFTYRLATSPRKKQYIYPQSITKVKYNDNVHCVEVEDNHTVYAGINNKYCITGQSVWGVAASRGFRLNDLRIANTITYIARTLIKKASSIIEQEFGYDVAMNDTDSCSIVVPKGIDAIEEGKKMQQIVNNKIDEFIKEEWGIQKHSINIEFEKLAKKAFFQTKKRYAMHIIYDVDDGECDKVKVTGFSSRRCLAGSTKIILKDYRGVYLTTMQSAFGHSLVNVNDREILTRDGFKKIRKIWINNIHKKDMYRITLITGQSVYASNNHRFPVFRNNKKQLLSSVKLKVGDKLMVCNKSIDYSTNGTYELGRLFGLIAAEGCISRKHELRLTFHEKERTYAKFIQEYVGRTFGLYVSIRQGNYEKTNHTISVEIPTSGFLKYVKSFLGGVYSYNKYLHRTAYNTSLKFKRGFIDGIFQGDGDVSGRYLNITSRRLRDDVVNFLSLIGEFPTGIYTRAKDKDRPNDRRVYCVRRADNTSCHSNYYNLKKCGNNTYWIGIKKIENNVKRHTICKTYDLEVCSNVHTFRLANGIVTHNSDVPQLSRDYQKQMLSMLLKDEVKSDIILYTKNEIDKIISGEYQITDLSMPVKLEHSMEEYKVQNVPKLRGIRWSNKNLNKHFREGTKFKMIYVKHPETDVVCFDDEDDLKNANLKIDYGKMVEKCIFQKIEPIFKTLNWGDSYKMLEYYAKNKLCGQKTLF